MFVGSFFSCNVNYNLATGMKLKILYIFLYTVLFLVIFNNNLSISKWYAEPNCWRQGNCYITIEATKSIWIELLCFQWVQNDRKCTCDCCPKNLTLPWLDFRFYAKWDRRRPKPQLRRLFPQIFPRTLASLNKQLHIFSQFSLIVLIMPRPTPIVIRHEVLARWPDSLMLPSTVSWRPAATGTLVPGKPIGAPQKTTPHQDHDLCRMVRQDRSICAQAQTGQMRNLYGVRAGWKTINNRFLCHGYRAYRPTRKPLSIAN